MTEEDAYYEWKELEQLIQSWDEFDIDSEYCMEICWRAGELMDFLLYGHHEPCNRSEWKCPPKDREGSAENYFRHAFCRAIKARGEGLVRELMERYNGEIPPPVPWKDYEPFVIRSRKFAMEHPDHHPDRGDNYEYRKNRWLRERRERRRRKGLE